jgi:hypothetical protein
MTLCENCGNEIHENRTHVVEVQGQQCVLTETDSKEKVGLSRRKIAKDLYKRKN